MQLSQSLDTVEEQLAAVSAAMVAMDPVMLEQSSVQLKQAAIQLAQVMESVRDKTVSSEMAARIQRVGEQLAVQRDNLARVAALVDRQAVGVLPPANNASTYGKVAGSVNGPGSGARIYRSAG